MPIFPKPIDLADDYVWTGDHTFDGVVTCNGDFNAVDGSFSGNLTSEVGGSYKLYNLGAEGDTDTEYLETSFDTNVATIASEATGAGTQRSMEIDAANVKLSVNGVAKFQVAGNGINYSYQSIQPPNSTIPLGANSRRWSTVYGIDGDFSGTLKTEGFKVGVAGTTQASITLSDTDHTVLADCTNNNILVNLPASAGNDGLQYTIKKVDATPSFCAVLPNGSDTIDGQAQVVITGQYESVNLVCYSGEWFLV